MAATSSGQFERCACERRLHTLLLPIAETIPASPTRPLLPLGLLADSVGNESVSCHSSANRAERTAFLFGE